MIMTSTDLEERAAVGARNLLAECAGIRSGEHVLIIAEPPGGRHYREGVLEVVKREARRLGAIVDTLEVPVPDGPESLPADIAQAIAAAGHTIFLSRLGDQLRFSTLPGQGSKIISYALDMESLGSSFGCAPFGLFQEVHDLVTARLLDARSYSLRCALGTEASMLLPPPDPARRAARVADFQVRNFPTMIIPAISASRLNGRLVFSHAFTSTYIHVYPDPVLVLPSPVAALVEDGTITGFEGEPGLVAHVRDHFERIGRFAGDLPFAINSWHTGINATTSFGASALSDIDRWASVAFGSPRYTHFHMCGPAPGDVCGQLFDVSIWFDDELIWDHGSLVFLSAEDRKRLAAKYGVPLDFLDARLDIGVPPLLPMASDGTR